MPRNGLFEHGTLMRSRKKATMKNPAVELATAQRTSIAPKIGLALSVGFSVFLVGSFGLLMFSGKPVRTPVGRLATPTTTPQVVPPNQEHPRLLFTTADIPALRTKVTNNAEEYDDQDYLKVRSDANSYLTQAPSLLVSTYYGLYTVPKLGIAYRLAADSDPKKPQFQQKCKDVLLYLANMYGPVTTDAHYSSMRLFVMAAGFDLCFDTISLPLNDPGYPQDRIAIARKMTQYLDPAVENSFDWKSREFPPYTSNGSTMVGSASGMAAIVLRGETDQHPEWLDSGLAWAHRVIEADLGSIFDPDGGANEGELYGPFGLRFLVPYAEARRRYDGLDLGQRGELRNLDRWLAYSLLPSGYLTQANDGNYTERGALWNDTYQSWAQTRYGSGIARWFWDTLEPSFLTHPNRDYLSSILWNGGAALVSPGSVLPDSTLARKRGFYNYRSGWTTYVPGEPTDTIFTFSAGAFGGGHAQEDQGTFSLYADNNWYSRDSGYSIAAKNSEAHNLVFVDNRGEHNAGNLIGTDASLTEWNLNGFADYLQADLKNAYSTYSPLNRADYPWPGTDWSWGYEVPPNTMTKADRHMLVMKRSDEAPEYFVVIDDMVKDGLPHTYDWTFHTELGMTVNTTSNPVTITPPASPGHRLNLYFANPAFSSLALSSARYVRNSNDPDTQRIKATITGVANPQFFVTMVPVTPTVTPPVSSMISGVMNGVGQRLTWAAATDDLFFRTNTGILSGEGTGTDGALALVRRSGGVVTKFTLAQGAVLQHNGVLLASVSGGKATVSSDGTEVSISNPSLSYGIWGPMVASVTSNRQPVPFVKDGDYVYVNQAPPLRVITGSIVATPVSPISERVVWNTNVPANSLVIYGTTSSYGMVSPLDATLTTAHQMALMGLVPATTYHYRVVSRLADGSGVISEDQVFTTQSDGEKPKPPIPTGGEKLPAVEGG